MVTALVFPLLKEPVEFEGCVAGTCPGFGLHDRWWTGKRSGANVRPQLPHGINWDFADS
jgi:hypothetical protein